MKNLRRIAKQIKVRKLFTIVAMMVISFVLTGCGTLQTLVQKDGETSPLSQWIGGKDQQAVPATTNLGDGKAVNLYFPDSTGKYLVKEERTLPKTLSLARETINEWVKGPTGKGNAQAAVAPATTLLDISVKDGIATVDFSKEFVQPVNKVSQEVSIYGLVNTLTQFPTVHEVKLRVEGKPLTKLGNLDLSHLSFNDGLVKDTSAVKSQGAGSSKTTPSSGGSAGTSGSGSNSVPSGTDSPSSMNLFSIPSGTT